MTKPTVTLKLNVEEVVILAACVIHRPSGLIAAPGLPHLQTLEGKLKKAMADHTNAATERNLDHG